MLISGSTKYLESVVRLMPKALQKEDKIGTMLPCNVIVQELSNYEIEVAAVDPIASMQAVNNEELAGIAWEIKEKLNRVINSLDFKTQSDYYI